MYKENRGKVGRGGEIIIIIIIDYLWTKKAEIRYKFPGSRASEPNII